jgi:uncharacterized RDD family membrane protein YckC
MPYGYTQHGYGYSYGTAYAYSGFWRRVAAYFVDSILLSVPTNIIRVVASAGDGGGAFIGPLSPGASVAVTLINVAIGVTYYAWLDGTRGQTVGKMALGIRVVDADTSEVIGAGRGVGRYFAKILSGLALGLGFLWMLWDDRKQCWQDKMVRSVVIKTQR